MSSNVETAPVDETTVTVKSMQMEDVVRKTSEPSSPSSLRMTQSPRAPTGTLTLRQKGGASPTVSGAFRQDIVEESTTARRPGGGSGGSAPQKESSEKRKTIDKLKRLTWLLLFASESILATLVGIQLLIIQAFLNDASLLTVTQQLQVLSFQFQSKIDLAGSNFATIATSNEVQSLLNSSTLSAANYVNYSTAISRFKQTATLQMKMRNAEYLTLVDKNRQIVVGANANRTGEIFDPSGLVSKALASCANSQIRATSFLSIEELVRENPPIRREGSLSYQANQHMFDTGNDGLIRYLVTTACDGQSSPLGALIYADVMSGKTLFLENSVGLYGNGFGKVVVLNPNGTIVPVVEVMYKQNFKNSYNLKISSSDLNTVVNQVMSSGTYSGVWNVLGDNYMISAMRTQPISVNGVPSNLTNAILIRGYPSDATSSIYSNIVIIDLSLMAGCMFFDVLGMLVSVRLFIDPLERLVYYIRMQEHSKYSATIHKINLNRRYFLNFVIFFAISLGFLIALVQLNYQAVQNAFITQASTKSEVELMNYAYQVKMNQMRYAAVTLRADANVQDLLAINTSSGYKYATSSLLFQIKKRQIEIAMILDKNGSIFVSGEPNAMVGNSFNPSGLVSDVLGNPRIVVATVVMNSSEYLATNPPTFTNSAVNSSLQLNSTLNPKNGFQGPVVIRFGVAPAYASGNNDLASPDGVIILGDLINGKAQLNELVVTAYKSGYAGIFYQDNSGKLTFLSGVYRSEDGAAYEYDVDISSLVQPYSAQMTDLAIGDSIIFQSMDYMSLF
eukprot:TRINITY_DN4195_c0_g1_i2.p1 TRINITY_DN4195_c0_g1~~TRINITY_DN4195_c0_g1_i2.p1  ORF type:complete len:829 (-),score=198.70 TRINITY_DN4195_c0_g1_i2:737-3103(-)